ncbi:hypothetical protein NECAME_04133 [Necator americanus]|uniref:Uncharacterized protein n=1 Tax=Necator americanus TaxID=51031 RepID=W2SWG5_NECAM|nr:hypothetical protein NECAME_04133 [Necator americanus]ETN74104.1 hypothetical protein NECAME_04133 [Necator americanus]
MSLGFRHDSPVTSPYGYAVKLAERSKAQTIDEVFLYRLSAKPYGLGGPYRKLRLLPPLCPQTSDSDRKLFERVDVYCHIRVDEDTNSTNSSTVACS